MKKHQTYLFLYFLFLFTAFNIPCAAHSYSASVGAQAAVHSVKKEGDEAIYIKSTQTLELSKNVKYMEPGAFRTVMVSKITVAPGNPYFKVENNVLYSKDGTVLVYYPRGKKGKTFQVPVAVKKIAALAFANCRELKKVILPKNLDVLGSGAFFGCTSLKNINLGQMRKLKEITDYDGYSGVRLWLGNGTYEDEWEPSVYYETIQTKKGYERILNLYYLGTFEGTRLSSVRIPDNVRFVSEETFRDCLSLKKITFGRNFEGDINIRTQERGKTVLLYELDLETIKFVGGNSRYCIRDNILCSRDGKVLYQYLDKKNKQRTALTISSKVSQVADGAFCKSHNLYTVMCEGPLTLVGQNAFASCHRLETFLAKGDIGVLGEGAFYGSFSLQSFQCRGSVGRVGTQAFCYCARLKEVLSAGLPELADDMVFEGCSALAEKKFSLYMPDGQ